jgi:hypothetical protein
LNAQQYRAPGYMGILRRITVTLSLLLCALPGLALAADDVTSVPPLIRFSGTLHNSSGEPLSGTLGVTFLIYKDEQGGAPLWIETQNVVADTNGHYSIILGSQHAHGIPSEIFVAGEARWLGVTPENLPELPRVLLATVPYAMKAADAETLGGRPASAYLLAPDPLQPQHSSGTSSVAALTSGVSLPATDTGTPNALAKFITSSTLGSSLLTDTGTALGVRIAAPEQALDILGRAQYRTEGIYTAGFFLRGTDTTPLVFVGQTGPKSADPFSIWHNGAWRLTIDKYGQVGVGTATPEYRFDVSGRMRVKAEGLNSAGLFFGPSNESPAVFLGQSGTARSDPFAIWHGGWRLVVASTGNVGIGTTTPTDRLEVAGNVRLSSSGALKFSDGTSMATAAKPFALSAADSTVSVTPDSSGANIRVNPAAITSTHLAPNSVTTSAIADGAISGTKINTAAILSNHLAPNAVTTSAIADGAISATKINTGSITSNHLAANAVTTSAIADGSITGTKIAVGAISPAAIIGTAATLGVNSYIGDQTVRGSLLAHNYSTTGTSQAVQGRTDSTAGIAIQAIASSTTGSTIALQANNSSNAGTVITADATSPSGTTTGVKATAAGGGGSAAIIATASATFTADPTYGVRAQANSQYGIGLFSYASSLTGTTKGISAKVESASGIAGEFTNFAGGVILAGYNNTNRVFRLDGTGDLWLDGVLHTGGADFAEMVAVTGPRTHYTPGDVLVISTDSDRALTLSAEPYSTSVAGVFSIKPGLLGSQHSQNSIQPDSEIPLAVIGIVPCNVTTENGPIHRGDLLTTSSTPGYAMKATDRSRMLGAIVGKALSNLDSGSGTIEILVTLQ